MALHLAELYLNVDRQADSVTSDEVTRHKRDL